MLADHLKDGRWEEQEEEGLTSRFGNEGQGRRFDSVDDDNTYADGAYGSDSANSSYGPIGCGRYDVLCGKDKTYGNHPGNRTFRAAILAFRDLYGAARCKQDKMTITRAVVNSLRDRHGARFVRFHDGRWEEISDVMARDKVSHALRFSLRETAGGGASVGGEGKQHPPTGVRKLLPQKTFSLKLVDPALRCMTATKTDLGGRRLDMPQQGSEAIGAYTLFFGGSNEYEYDDDNNQYEDDDETEAAESLRKCQVLIFKSLRFDDPLEDGLDLSIQAVSFVRQAAAV